MKRLVAALALLSSMIYADTGSLSTGHSSGEDVKEIIKGMSWSVVTFDGLEISNHAAGPEGNLRFLSFISDDGYLLSVQEMSLFVGNTAHEQGFSFDTEDYSIGSASNDSGGIFDFLYRHEQYELEIARQELYESITHEKETHAAVAASMSRDGVSMRYDFNGFGGAKNHNASLSYSLNIFSFSPAKAPFRQSLVT